MFSFIFIFFIIFIILWLEYIWSIKRIVMEYVVTSSIIKFFIGIKYLIVGITDNSPVGFIGIIFVFLGAITWSSHAYVFEHMFDIRDNVSLFDVIKDLKKRKNS